MTYHIRWGYMGSCTAVVATFDEALEIYRQHRGADLTGEDQDGDHDGLTEDERERLEASDYQAHREATDGLTGPERYFHERDTGADDVNAFDQLMAWARAERAAGNVASMSLEPTRDGVCVSLRWQGTEEGIAFNREARGPTLREAGGAALNAITDALIQFGKASA